MALFTAVFAASATDGEEVSVRAGLLISRLLARCQQRTNGKNRQPDARRRPFIILTDGLEILFFHIRSSVLKSIQNAQIQNGGFVPIWYGLQNLCL